MDFTPKQLHYFKRELISYQLDSEINKLITSADISTLLDITEEEIKREFPFLRYIFTNIVIEFPLLKHTCDTNFWTKCKVFLNEFNKVQLDSYFAPRDTEGSLQRKAIKHKVQKSLVFAFCASIKTFQGNEESIRVTNLPQMTEGQDQLQQPEQQHKSCLTVNIVTVREIKEKKTLRELSHAEFLMETYLPNQKEAIYVARRHGDFRRLRDELKQEFKNFDIPPVPSKSANTTHQHGYRENDRLLLRAWLHQIVGEKENMSKSQHLISMSQPVTLFLSQNPITFTVEEEKDCLQRERFDQERLMEQQKFKQELDRRVFELTETLDVLKKQIIEPGGLIHVFEVIKSTKDLKDLPLSLKKVFEWGRINFAFALHKQFVTSDIASENLNNLCRTHGLIPYRTMAVILKFSNPMSMVKGILDLFLAQPFGGRSLFQRIIISNMNEESKSFQKDIELLETKIQDKMVCTKLYHAVRTIVPENDKFRDQESDMMEVLSLLENDVIEPVLNDEQKTRIIASKRLLKRTIQLWELYARQYEQELMMNLVFQGVTGELLKEFIAVFYQPLAEVYKAADIGTTIRHVSTFLDDLIQVIKQDKEGYNVSDTIQLFIDLVERHEQHFYDFVHNVHSQEASKVFDELIQYVDKLFTFFAHGIPGKIDMNYCIERAGYESSTDLKLLEDEINSICDYRYRQKMYHFERTRRKLMVQQQQRDEIFNYIPKSSEMMGVLEDFEEFEYSQTHDSSSSSEDEGYDDDDLSTIPSRRSSKSSGSHVSHKGLDKPELNMIPKIVPFFVNDIIDIM
ncbi:hypothetical protein BDF21DRAFT_374185 [Thamnidium elegans]|uniref:PX domain-containing protein n=1 Tax=Thamnidium elegans TaxID=101142 RepID=A0A8H7SYY5_9FUNG|nr:hypothetical protein INT48_000711 [Thamnidium elegans]KAI8095789.1 hypothetical protein BDF21DRAFT_374185 [Thamnidium elegans]